MKKNYFKKSLSLLLVALMLMTSWVFVAPEKAEAAVATSYGMTTVGDSFDKATMSISNQGTLTITYPSKMYLDVSESLQDVGYYLTMTATSMSKNLYLFPVVWGGQEFGSTYNTAVGLKNQTVFVDNFNGYGLTKATGADGWFDNTTYDNQGCTIFACGNPQGYLSNDKYMINGTPNNTSTTGTFRFAWSNYDTNTANPIVQAIETDAKNRVYISNVSTSGTRIDMTIYVYNKAPLSTAVNNALPYYNDRDGYTAETAAALVTAYNNAQSVLSNRKVTQAEVTSATTALNNAVSALKEKKFYITFENLFSVTDWAASSSFGYDSSKGEVTVEPANNYAIKLYKNVTGEITTSSSYPNSHNDSYYSIPVTAGKQYTVKFETTSSVSGGTIVPEIFLFWYGSNNAAVNNTDGTNTFNNKSFSGNGTHSATFTAPSGATKAEIRFDNDCSTSGSTIRFNNVRIYSEDRAAVVDNMSNWPVTKVYAYKDVLGTTLGVPSRPTHDFNGWYLDSNGNGTKDLGEEVTDAQGNVVSNLQSFAITANYNLLSDWTPTTFDVGYDNLFSLVDWSKSDSKNVNNSNLGQAKFDTTNGTITVNTTGTEVFTNYGSADSHYQIAVEPNTEYIFEANMNLDAGTKGQMFVFFYNAAGAGVTGAIHNGTATGNSHIGIYPTTNGKHSIAFTTPAGCTQMAIRVGATEAGTTATYSNIKFMKKADYDAYAKNYSTVRFPFQYGDTTQLTYEPARDGYVFDGWVDGEGNKITSVAGLSASDTVYATWTKLWTVTFKNWNGDIIKTVTVKNGEAAEVPTDIPARVEDETNHYTFDSWYGLPPTITADVDVFATYKATAHGNFTYEQVSAPDCETNAIVDKYCGDENCRYLVADNVEYDGEDEKYLALGHEFDANDILKGNQDGTHAIKCVRYRDCGATDNVDCNFVAYKTDGADCVTLGTVYKRCACGDETTAAGETDSSNHKSTEIRDDKLATCTENGYTGDEFCTACGEYTGVKGTVIPATGHKWENTDTFLKDEADCFTGNVYWQECSVCHISAENDTTNTGSTWTDENSKLTHDWKETEKYNKTQADCVTDEVYYYECALCGSSSETITGKTWTKSEAWDHNFTGDYVPNGDGTHNRECVNAGCTETGATESCDSYYGEWKKVDADTHEHTCTLCDYTPAATAHNWTDWESTDAALEADGQHSRYCSDNCGATETEACTYTRTEKAETCTEGGYTIHSCDVCDHEYRTEGAPSKGHKYEGEYKFDTATDMHQRACLNGCGTYGSGTELDKWTACEFEYTNTADGKHLAECKYCDNEQEEDCSGTQATCTSKAVCAKCNEEFGTTTDHSFKGAAVQLEGDEHAYLCEYCGEDTGYYGVGNKLNDTEPCQGGTATCSKLAECTACGDEHGDYDEDAHKWGEWTFNGDSETKTHIRACEYNPDHTEDGECYSPDSKVFAADCETDGYTLNTCEFCAHEWQTQIIPALDHDWSGDWVNNEDGTHTKTCQDSTCKYGENGAAKTKTEACSKDNAKAVVTKPTCLTDGYTTYTCNDCGFVWVDDEVPATGHSYDKKIIVEKADYKRTDRDCVTALTYWYRCDNCDVSAETEKDKYDDETVLYGVVLEALGHDFTKKDTAEKYLVSPATCYDRAVYNFSCSACGEKGTTTFESGSVLEHEWEEKETFLKSEADCVNNEVYYYQCALCDASSETITGKTWEKADTLKGHDFDHDNDEVIGNEGDTGYTAYVAPDCINDGIEEHYTCEVCDKMFKDAEGKTAITKITITKLGHDWEDVKYKAPSCEEDGHTAYQACTKCDATLGKTVYPATGHNFTGAYYCDTANNYHSFLCRNNCGESGIVVDEEQVKYVVEFDGLDWVIVGGIKCDFTGEYVNETDENGIHSHALKCECGNETSAVCVDEEPTTVDPNCTDEGYTLHVCDVCSYEWKTDIVDALGHDTTGTATPNGDGTHSVECSKCDYKTAAEKCSGGTATCKDKAVCTVCGGEYGETTSHTFDEATWEYQNDAKCGVDGTEKNSCSVCGEEDTRVAEGTALKHELSDWIYEVEPTCKNEGKKYQKCTREGCDYRTKTVTEPKSEDAHVWETDENGEIVWVYVGGDCGKGVTYKNTCTVCGKIQTEIRETDHQFIVSEYGATCTTAGTIKEVCSVCGYTTTREGAPATGHTFNEGTVQKKATCAQEGRMLYTCETCGYEETQPIEKTAHGWALEGAVEDRDYIVVSAKAPTCDINGYNEYIKCLHCATGMMNYEEIPATGHADNDGNGKCDECNSALYGDNGEKSCGCICHKESGLMKFIYKILRFFWKLFGISQSCNCGATHY